MGKNKIDCDVASFILDALIQEGITHVFFVPGYLIDPFLPKFQHLKSKIEPIIASHEGGAAYMADGYGRASQNFGVCMGIGGPGVTNMVTAISAAYGDRSPVLVIAGRIPSSWEGKGAFQDSSSSVGIDDIAIMRPITEFAAAVPNVRAAQLFLRKAIRVIRDVESLPVFLSIPEDVQRMQVRTRYIRPDSPGPILDRHAALNASKLLSSVPLIAILAGNGSVRSRAWEELKTFAEEFSIPVVTTLRAKGVIPEDSKMSFGVFGLGGSLRANKVIMGSDRDNISKPEVLLVLGATLNENNTYMRNPNFPPEKHLILVDINPNTNRDAEYPHHLVMGDVKEFLSEMRANTKLCQQLRRTKPLRDKWIGKIQNTPWFFNKVDRTSDKQPIHPARAIADLRKVADKYDNAMQGHSTPILVVDSGAHTFFAGHHWISYRPNEFLFMSTTGPMGYGIAMGIGAKLARPDSPCICVVGDGSMLMHGMELRTAVRHKVPLIVVVLNNRSLANVYLRFNKQGEKSAAELVRITEPDQNWADFARSLGAESVVVEDPKKLVNAYEQAFQYTQRKNSEGPFLVDIICDKDCEPPNQTLEQVDGQKRMRQMRDLTPQYYLPHM